ncbi:hypothetical protein [Sulfurimonas sp.]|uniref:hypothetical protein n=1 Tax=Sulfurimonas sp. TaxID=2022749 RepID=UPI0025EEA27C|nr:hypothetical protein [Sulfurimonas sp.]
MYKTQEEKQKYIDKLFNDRTLFEWEVLHVSTHYDRVEIMLILAQTLVRNKLKHEINFLYLQSFIDLKFQQIVNILFHEIANEWMSFATEVLNYPKKEAIVELKEKSRVKFIHGIADDYYDKYRRYIFEEIADTFIELVSKNEQTRDSTFLIQETLQSDLIKNKQLLELHNFTKLNNRIKVAQDIKKSNIVTAKMKIMDIKEKSTSSTIDIKEKIKLQHLLKEAKKEPSRLELEGLDKFDPAIKRLKDTMVQSMISMS